MYLLVGILASWVGGGLDPRFFPPIFVGENLGSPWKFNSEFTPEKWPNPNRKGSRLPVPSFFRGELLNFRGVLHHSSHDEAMLIPLQGLTSLVLAFLMGESMQGMAIWLVKHRVKTWFFRMKPKRKNTHAGKTSR